MYMYHHKAIIFIIIQLQIIHSPFNQKYKMYY